MRGERVLVVEHPHAPRIARARNFGRRLVLVARTERASRIGEARRAIGSEDHRLAGDEIAPHLGHERSIRAAFTKRCAMPRMAKSAMATESHSGIVSPAPRIPRQPFVARMC